MYSVKVNVKTVFLVNSQLDSLKLAAKGRFSTPLREPGIRVEHHHRQTVAQGKYDRKCNDTHDGVCLLEGVNKRERGVEGGADV